jgi:hypothetical protein
MKKFITPLFLLLFSNLSAQNNNSVSYGIGINWQSTVMNFLNFKFVNDYGYPKYFIPHNYERNLQGLGIPLYLRVNFSGGKYFFEYSPNFRYDEVYFRPDSTKKFHVTPVKQIIVNQSFSLNKRFNKGKNYIKGGVTWFNPFKTIPTETVPIPDLVASINYIALDCGLGLYLLQKQKVELNLNAQYISKGQMQTLATKNGYVTYSVRILYLFINPRFKN